MVQRAWWHQRADKFALRSAQLTLSLRWLNTINLSANTTATWTYSVLLSTTSLSSLFDTGTPFNPECDLPRVVGIERGVAWCLPEEIPARSSSCVFESWHENGVSSWKKELTVSFLKAPHCEASLPIGWGLMYCVMWCRNSEEEGERKFFYSSLLYSFSIRRRKRLRRNSPGISLSLRVSSFWHRGASCYSAGG